MDDRGLMFRVAADDWKDSVARFVEVLRTSDLDGDGQRMRIKGELVETARASTKVASASEKLWTSMEKINEFLNESGSSSVHQRVLGRTR